MIINSSSSKTFTADECVGIKYIISQNENRRLSLCGVNLLFYE